MAGRGPACSELRGWAAPRDAGGASGFCIYNDASLAIARLLELGAERVAYIDVDVHHGDGVQAAFWEDPRVLTISLHEHPRTLFPQTGWPEETGAGAAEGSAVNVALPAGTGDAGWLRAFHAVVPELIRDFRPQVLVTQHGADTHFEDPLAHLAVSLDAQRAVQVACHELAHEYADGKWVALGGGGYAVVEVVPRSWTHLVGIAAGRAIEPEAMIPEGWRQEVFARTRQLGPARMTDGRWPISWGSGRRGTTLRIGWIRRCWLLGGPRFRCGGCCRRCVGGEFSPRRPYPSRP